MAATRATSSVVTASMRSRFRKNRRQSPIEAHSLSPSAIPVVLLKERSIPVSSAVLARSTSSCVAGFVLMSSIVSPSTCHARSRSSSGRTMANAKYGPGSRRDRKKPWAVTASWGSTRAW